MAEENTQNPSDSVRLQEIKEEIKTIGDRSTWLLGFLTIIIAGLTSFIFQGLNAVINESNVLHLKPATLSLLVHYLAITFFILLVQMLSFFDSTSKNKTEVNAKKSKIMRLIYRTAIVFAIISLFLVCGFAIHFSYI